MKSIILSTFLHIFIFMSGYIFNSKKSFQIDSPGNNLTVSNITTNFSLNKREVFQKKIKKEKLKDIPIEKKIIKKKKKKKKKKKEGKKKI